MYNERAARSWRADRDDDGYCVARSGEIIEAKECDERRSDSYKSAINTNSRMFFQVWLHEFSRLVKLDLFCWGIVTQQIYISYGKVPLGTRLDM